MYKDFYFEMKNKYANINFIIMPNYYPSNRTYNKITWYINISCIYSTLITYCIIFWINDYKGIYYDLYEYMFLFSFISFMSLANILIMIIIFTYSILIISSYILNKIKLATFNYMNHQPLFYNKIEDPVYVCWICETVLSKHKTLKKLNCPCQEYFHPDCIDKYLGLYNNYCRDGHRIAKYNHIV
jgi:hypothetical protein